MSQFHLRIITPRKIVLEEEVNAVTIPSADGELTILPRHTNLFALLIEGVVKIKKSSHEDFLAIGGGYAETNGKEINILVSKAYHQDEIDKGVTEKAIEEAKKILKTSTDGNQRLEAGVMLRRSLVDLKLLKKKAPRSFSGNV
ncbi:ATP synthase F1 subunit epsilon [Candidatus Roizmanbacteria bacterium]|nr:ATP synthase F1 subunit epsilon [Candidatus Roizmanbacteria bacterium]